MSLSLDLQVQIQKLAELHYGYQPAVEIENPWGKPKATCQECGKEWPCATLLIFRRSQ